MWGKNHEYKNIVKWVDILRGVLILINIFLKTTEFQL